MITREDVREIVEAEGFGGTLRIAMSDMTSLHAARDSWDALRLAETTLAARESNPEPVVNDIERDLIKSIKDSIEPLRAGYEAALDWAYFMLIFVEEREQNCGCEGCIRRRRQAKLSAQRDQAGLN